MNTYLVKNKKDIDKNYIKITTYASVDYLKNNLYSFLDMDKRVDLNLNFSGDIVDILDSDGKYLFSSKVN